MAKAKRTTGKKATKRAIRKRARRNNRFLYIYNEQLEEKLLWLGNRMAVIVIVFGVILLSLLQQEISKAEEIQSSWQPIEERIPLDEEVKDYIDSLPMPEECQKIDLLRRLDYLAEEKLMLKQEEAKQTQGQEEKVIKTTLNVSAYCPCKECCGKTDCITASMTKARQWHTVAAGKKYPMGTKIYIPALADMPNGGWFVVEDRGGAISNSKLDVYFDSHTSAKKFGRQYLECEIYLPE